MPTILLDTLARLFLASVILLCVRDLARAVVRVRNRRAWLRRMEVK